MGLKKYKNIKTQAFSVVLSTLFCEHPFTRLMINAKATEKKSRFETSFFLLYLFCIFSFRFFLRLLIL